MRVNLMECDICHKQAPYEKEGKYWWRLYATRQHKINGVDFDHLDICSAGCLRDYASGLVSGHNQAWVGS